MINVDWTTGDGMTRRVSSHVLPRVRMGSPGFSGFLLRKPVSGSVVPNCGFTAIPGHVISPKVQICDIFEGDAFTVLYRLADVENKSLC